MGFIMLPFLLASALGIVLFSFNIFFVNYNKNQAVNNSSAVQQSRPAGADARVNPNQNRTAPIAATPALPSPTEPAETARTAAVPVGGVRSQQSAEARAPREQVAAGSGARNAPAPTRAETQNWSIQAGAFSAESSAVQIKNKIEPLGYGVRIVKTEAQRPLFRVMVSPGNSRDAPGDALKKLNSIGIEGYIISGRS